MDIPTINDVEINTLLRTARGTKTLENLKNDLVFVDVFNTVIGKELLRDLLSRHSYLLEIICNPDSEVTVAQKAEYRIVRLLIKTWATRIENYLTGVENIKGTQRKE